MVCQTVCSLVERDLTTLWHPFTQRTLDPPPLPLSRAKGSYLYTTEGIPFLDGISSWWVNLHGHLHPHIMGAIHAQCEELDQVMFTEFTHAPAVELAGALLPHLPGKPSRLFFSDNGSTAVEVALKMALQYHSNRGLPKRKILAFTGGYHGDTFGAMSLAGAHLPTLPFHPYLFPVERIDPTSEEAPGQLKALLAGREYACLIYEPLIQGVRGMRSYPLERLTALLDLCKKAGVLLIADEVMTGFGRTGPLFASTLCPITPDLICLSKGLTGGTLPLGATACQEYIYEAFLSSKREEAFLHGHSYTANPLACAAARASWELTSSTTCTTQREQIHHHHTLFCQRHQGHPRLLRLECLGTLLVLEFDAIQGYASPLRDQLLRHFLERKISLRPLGNVLYVMPPYCITAEELTLIYNAIEEFLCSYT